MFTNHGTGGDLHFRVLLAGLLCFLSLELVISSVTFAAMRFSGVVCDPGGNPLDKAIVRLKGTTGSTATDDSGRFEVVAGEDAGSKYITAWKKGFYNGGQDLAEGGAEYRIILNPVNRNDNEKYTWLPSSQDHLSVPVDGKTDLKPCHVCHGVITEQWKKSTHRDSAISPVFLAFFTGKNYRGEKLGPGYKTDFPNSNGNCATCHAPVLAIKNPFNSDPSSAGGLAKEGVSCDLCHKIGDVRIDTTGGYPGVLSIRFNRPPEGHQVFYGPYDDVFPGEDSYHPLYKESRYCAPCHNGKFWDVLMYSEFQEWADSDYAAKNIHCQACHMAPDGTLTRFAAEKEGGIARRPETVPSHLFNGISDRAFMEKAVDMSVAAEPKDNVLDVVVTVRNVKAGHHYPSGNPMRNMILLVDVRDEDGNSLPLIQGGRVPVWGGTGDVKDGNYAGLPGKGFAKVLRDVIPYPDGRVQRHFRPQYPAPHWRPTMIESDNRLPANGSDISRYRFSLPGAPHGTLHVASRLIYRRSYKNWLDAKGLKSDDMEIAFKALTVKRLRL